MASLATALRVGYSVENALRETKRDLLRLYDRKSRIIHEYQIMIHQLDINFSTEQVLGELAKRVIHEDVENFVTVFSSAKRMGGDSINIIRRTTSSMMDKIEVERDIQTILSAKEFEFNVMSFIPLIIICYMRLTFSEFMGILYGNLLGVGIMTAALGVYFSAVMLGYKIIKIDI